MEPSPKKSGLVSVGYCVDNMDGYDVGGLSASRTAGFFAEPRKCINLVNRTGQLTFHRNPKLVKY